MSAIGICQANGCGERVGPETKYCRSCSTPEKRAANQEAQRKVDDENRAKGYKIPPRSYAA